MVLLFGNSFAAYATAYGLTGGFVSLVPLRSATLVTGDVLSNPHIADALALGMFVVLGLMMAVYVPLQRLTSRWVRVRTRIAPSAVVWLVVGPGLLPAAALRHVPLQPQRRDHRRVLHVRQLRGDRRRPGVLEDAAPLVRPRARDDRDRAPAPRADGLLGAPEAAAPAACDRVPRARPVRRPADHPRGRAARRSIAAARPGSTPSRTASSSPRT